MAKVNALILRYRVEIDNEDIFGSDIISVAGFDLGEEGTIEVPEWDRIALVSDGKRKIVDVALKYRLMDDMKTHDYFKDWWDTRAISNRDISVIWTSRDYDRELFRWVFLDCEFRKFNGEDQELGATKLGVLECTFAPYDVDIRKQ